MNDVEADVPIGTGFNRVIGFLPSMFMNFCLTSVGATYSRDDRTSIA
jgi:hypothetical protein